jgi:hypothetical protein
MQAPDIHSGESPEEKQAHEDNEQRQRKAMFTIELEWFGRRSDVHALLQYLDRSVQLRFHDETLHFKAVHDGEDQVLRWVAPMLPQGNGPHAAGTVLVLEDGQSVCQLCGRPGPKHNMFCRLYEEPYSEAPYE